MGAGGPRRRACDRARRRIDRGQRGHPLRGASPAGAGGLGSLRERGSGTRIGQRQCGLAQRDVRPDHPFGGSAGLLPQRRRHPRHHVRQREPGRGRHAERLHRGLRGEDGAPFGGRYTRAGRRRQLRLGWRPGVRQGRPGRALSLPCHGDNVSRHERGGSVGRQGRRGCRRTPSIRTTWSSCWTRGMASRIPAPCSAASARRP